MLDVIRRHQQSWLVYLIFGAIIVVFMINFGPGSSGCQSLRGPGVAATVDGDIIRQQEFALSYQSRLERMRRSAQGGKFAITPEMAEKMGLKKQVIDDLINRKLLAHEASRMGLVISDDELLDYLHTAYGLKEDMSPEDYSDWVEANFRTTIKGFQDRAREELRAQRLAQLVTEQVTVGDGELKRNYLKERDRAMIDYVKFDPKPDAASTPSAKDVDALLATEHKAVEERFARDRFKYSTPEQRRVQQIVRTLPRDASDAQVAKERGLLLELKGQIEGGAEFAGLAKENSQDDQTRDKGGEIGWVKRGQLARPVEDVLFGLNVGELSKEPVRTPMGLHLIKLEEIKPSVQKDLKDVEREVAASILRDRAADQKAKEEADAFLAELKGGKEMTALTVSEDELHNLEPDAPKPDKPVRYESPWIQKSEPGIPRIGVDEELQKKIFELTDAAPLLGEVHKVGRAYYVMRLKQREVPDMAKFESEKDNLRSQAVWQKRDRVFRDWLKHLRSQAKVDLNPEVFQPADAAQS